MKIRRASRFLSSFSMQPSSIALSIRPGRVLMNSTEPSGFLRGWLKGEPHATSATWANACGAFAVSRLLCAPEYPSWEELQFFLEHGSPVVPCTREATLVHMVDNLGGRLGSFDRLEKELAPGASWSSFDRAIGSGAFFARPETAPEPAQSPLPHRKAA